MAFNIRNNANLDGRNILQSSRSPMVDRENIGQARQVGKDILLSGRKHAAPKQAFGEIKNTIHNKQIFTPHKENIRLAKTPQLKPKDMVLSNRQPKQNSRTTNLEYIWAKQSVLKNDDIFKILNGTDKPAKNKGFQSLECLQANVRDPFSHFDEPYKNIDFMENNKINELDDIRLPELPPCDIWDL